MNDASADPAMETAVKWAHLYVSACGDVLDAANACLEVANLAIGARDMATQRPQHEISIRNFTKHAEQKEEEFAPLYRTFADACDSARNTAARFLAAQTEHEPELVLMLNVEEPVLDKVATVKEILRVNFGPTPADFIEGIEAANALMQNPSPEGGNIYTPLPPAQSDERACPWCAETIKAAAVVCRFCGRDVQVQPNVS